MATLHFICGKAGAGKTTLARELGRRAPAVVICEDEWISTLGFQVRALEQYLDASARCRSLIASLVPELLRQGANVVLDFAGNTVKGRAWVRSLFEAAKADHQLHWLDASDEVCLARIHQRNAERPEGLYWGQVADELFHQVTARFVAPGADERFEVVRSVVKSAI